MGGEGRGLDRQPRGPAVIGPGDAALALRGETPRFRVDEVGSSLAAYWSTYIAL